MNQTDNASKLIKYLLLLLKYNNFEMLIWKNNISSKSGEKENEIYHFNNNY